MKISFLIAALSLLASVAPAFADNAPLTGAWYVCSDDLDQEKRFSSTGVAGSLEDETKRVANGVCDNLCEGSAINVVYVYRDGSQKADH